MSIGQYFDSHMRFAGIKRKSLYSPNHITNDTLILTETAEALKKLGVEVTVYDEGAIGNGEVKEKIIFSMAQGPAANERLIELEEGGALIINSPRAVMNCYRVNMVRLLEKNNIPFPRSVVISTMDSEGAAYANGFSSPKMWIKRGDVHAVHREDVTLVYSVAERVSIVNEFWKRGVEQVILQQHIDGDVIKFYSVRGTDFFYWYYLNGVNHTPFDLQLLRHYASMAAEVLGLWVYGGDAIVSKDSSITIIDINDWPSFAPIRSEASQYISKLIYLKAKEYVSIS
jgi:glutathione synthase/RimK-type ligase-like ATP-grasp enzyme